MTTLAPFPVHDPLVDRGARVARHWRDWFLRVWDAINAAPQTVSVGTSSAQAAAISVTTLVTPTVAGLYRATWALRITQAATSSSSAMVVIGWTDGGVALTAAGPALTGNTVTSTDVGTVLLRADAATPVTLQVTYSSIGATAMQYAVSVVVERVA